MTWLSRRPSARPATTRVVPRLTPLEDRTVPTFTMHVPNQTPGITPIFQLPAGETTATVNVVFDGYFGVAPATPAEPYPVDIWGEWLGLVDSPGAWQLEPSIDTITVNPGGLEYVPWSYSTSHEFSHGIIAAWAVHVQYVDENGTPYSYGGLLTPSELWGYVAAMGNAILNSQPTAAPDEIVVHAGETVYLSYDLTNNDTDLEGGIHITGAERTGRGTVEFVDYGGGVLYTAPTIISGAEEEDTFTYSIGDAHGGSATGTVTVRVVNAMPVPNPAAWEVMAGGEGDGTVTASDPDGDAITLLSVSQAGHGVVTVVGDMSFHYRTNSPYFEGTDSFTYTVSDGHGGTDSNTVTVTVYPAPVSAYAAQAAAEADSDGATVPGIYVLQRPAESTLYTLRIGVYFISTGDGVASPWSDYDNGSGVMEATFPAGATTAILTLPAHKDNYVEGTEVIRSVFRAGSGYRVNGSGADAPVDLDLYDDPPVVWVGADENAAEAVPAGGVKAGRFTLSRSGGDTSQSLGVSLRIDGTAAYGDDYTVAAMTWTADEEWDEVTLNPAVGGGTGVVFEPNETTKVLTVTPKKDNKVEGTEGVGVEVLPGRMGYIVGYPGAASLQLADDPPVVAVRTKQDTETEEPEAAAEAGPGGVKAGRFVVSRTGGKPSDPLGARLRFTGGTADPDADYTVVAELWDAETEEWEAVTLVPDEDGWVDVVFGPDEMAIELTVWPKKDNRVEGTETVRVEVGDGGVNYLVGDPGAAVMDLRDDPPVVVIETDELSVPEGQTGEMTLRRSGGDVTTPLTVVLNVRADDDDGATLWEPDGVSKAETVGTVKVTFKANEATVKATVIPEIDMEEHVARRLLVSVEDDIDDKYLAGVDNEATVIVTELPEAGWEGAYWDWVEDWQLNGWLWMDDEFVLLGHPAWTTPGEDVTIQQWASSETDVATWYYGGVAGNPPDSTLAGTDILADGWDRLIKRTEGPLEEVYFVRMGWWSGKPITDPVWLGTLVPIGQTLYVRRGDKFLTLEQVQLRVANRGWWWQNSGRTADQWDRHFALYDTQVTSTDDRVISWKSVDAERLISNTIERHGNEARDLIALMRQTPYEVVHSTTGGYGSYRLAGLGASYRIEIDDYYRGGLYSRSLRDASDALFQALKEYKPEMEAAKVVRKAVEDWHLGVEGEGRMRFTETEVQRDLLEARLDGKVWAANEVTRAAIQGVATAVGVAAGTIPWDRVATFMWNRGLALKKGNVVIERATGREITKKEMDDCAREYFRQEQLYTQRATVIVRATAPTAAAKMVEQMAEVICFARDTLVATADGPKPIGSIQPGERVRAFDFEAGRWVLAEVEKRHDNVYVGPVFTLQAGETCLETTVNHPFWVVEGEGLAARETPGELEPGEDEGRSLPGRWVNSQDVRVGDVVQSRDGRRLVVTGMAARDEEAFPVSNLTVRDHHSYAVGPDGVLVHNGSHWCSIYKRARPVPQSLINFIERVKFKNPLIHAHHIVMKGDFADWNAVDRAYVTGARDILARCEIKALRTEGELSAAVAAGDSLENMCWALHYHGNIHSQKYAKWVFKELEKAEMLEGAQGVKAALKRMGGQMEKGDTPWLTAQYP